MTAPKFALSLLLTCALTLTPLQPARCAATVGDITYAIQAAHILEPSTPFNVAVEGDKIRISTYRDSRENEKDRKINAVLMAKAAIETAGDTISRVTVYFYGKDLSQYQEVSVTSGDIKAFATGQTSQEQLLSALTLESRKQDSNSDRVARQLEAGAYARPDYKVSVNGSNQMLVATTLADWVPDDEAMLEALRLANSAAQAAPANVSDIKISFVDPRGKGSTREVTFSTANAKAMWEKVRRELSAVPMGKIAPTSEVAVPSGGGPLREQRAKLLDRINALAKAGVGVSAFMKAYEALEASVPTSDEGTIKAAIDHLNQTLDEQEKSAKAAKDAKFSKAGGANDLPTGALPKLTSIKSTHESRFCCGKSPILDDEAVNNPAEVIARKERELPNSEHSIRMYRALLHVAALLELNGRKEIGAQYRRRAAQMQAAGKMTE